MDSSLMAMAASAVRLGGQRLGGAGGGSSASGSCPGGSSATGVTSRPSAVHFERDRGAIFAISLRKSYFCYFVFKKNAK